MVDAGMRCSGGGGAAGVGGGAGMMGSVGGGAAGVGGGAGVVCSVGGGAAGVVGVARMCIDGDGCVAMYVVGSHVGGGSDKKDGRDGGAVRRVETGGDYTRS